MVDSIGWRWLFCFLAAHPILAVYFRRPLPVPRLLLTQQGGGLAMAAFMRPIKQPADGEPLAPDNRPDTGCGEAYDGKANAASRSCHPRQRRRVAVGSVGFRREEFGGELRGQLLCFRAEGGLGLRVQRRRWFGSSADGLP